MRVGLKFAVVREDPELEAQLIRQRDVRRVLTVASGGCTVLSLLAAFPALDVTAFDLNPLQLAHLGDKAAAAAAGERARLNIDAADEHGLNQCGEFESLFRLLRNMVREFVAEPGEIHCLFDGAPDDRAAIVERWIAHRYWPAAFASCFADGLLEAMFGPAATQHAVRGSYPGYFQGVFERGLRRSDAARNPFLQHVFLGAYRAADAPLYARTPSPRRPELIRGGLEQVPALERFDLYCLSNVFDWSEDALVADWAARLKRAARPGSTVLIRQLNNTRDLAPLVRARVPIRRCARTRAARARSQPLLQPRRGRVSLMSARIEVVGPDGLRPYLDQLQRLEAEIKYPIGDGSDYFTIDHGRDYHEFFSALGAPMFMIAVEGSELVGIFAGIERTARAGGETVKTIYGADFKLAARVRGSGLSRRMIWKGFLIGMNPSFLRRWRVAYVTAMRGARGDVTRSLRGLHVGKLARPGARLSIYFTDPAQLAALRVDGAPPPPAPSGMDLSPDPQSRPPGLVSTAGKKDLRLHSTGAPWPLVHLPLGPSAWGASHAAYLRRAGEALVAEKLPGPTCFALDDRLADHVGWLAAQGITPGAVCTVYTFGLPGAPKPSPWVHLATSQI